MSIFEEISAEAGAVTKYTLRLALAVLVAGFALGIGSTLLGGSGGPVIFICSMLLALIMALFAVGLALFKIVQIRLAELLLVVAVLGNTLGFACRGVGDSTAVSVGGRVTLGMIIALPCLVWTLGGAAWGLWIAKELLIDRAMQRIWLVTLGLLVFPAFACAVGALPLAVVSMTSLNGPLAALCVFLFFGSFAVLLYAVRLHTRVLKERADSGHTDEL